MSALDEILSTLPLDQLAQQLGASPDDVRKAAGPAVTSLLGGLTQNAQDPAGEAELASALQDHAGRDVVADGQAKLEAVDQGEGEKIVDHVFGNQADGVANALAGQQGVDQQMVRKLLPLLAPVVLAYLGKRFGQGGNPMGSILSQVLGGGNQSGVLGGVLSQVLGGVLGHGQQGQQVDPGTAQATTQAARADGGDIVSQILGGLLHRN